MNKKQILDFLQEIKTPCRTTDIATRFEMSAYQARHYLYALKKREKSVVPLFVVVPVLYGE